MATPPAAVLQQAMVRARTRSTNKIQEEAILFGPNKQTRKAAEKYDKKVKAATKKQ